MGEIGDLVVVVGELDRELVRMSAANPDNGAAARQRAAQLIPPLGRADAPGWYDRFLRATGSTAPVTGLEQALQQLVGLTTAAVRPAHLLAIVGAVSRALPDFKPGNDRAGLIVDVLTRDGIVEGVEPPRAAPEPPEAPPEPSAVGREAAQLLHELLDDTEALPTIGDWHVFRELERVQPILHADLRSAAAACSSVVVPVVTRDGDRLAVAVRADVCVGDVDFDQTIAAGGFLNPANWRHYQHWCAMQPAAGNPDDWREPCRFLESVALDCATGWWDVKVWLDFTALALRDLQDNRRVAFREYAMVPVLEAPPGGNGLVRVDEGSFAVREEQGDDGARHLRVSSTKRVEFTQGVDEAALAVLACSVGYGALSTAFVVDGLGGQATAVACEPSPRTTFGAAVAGPGEVDPLDEPVRELEATIDACVDAAGSAFTQMAEGRYTVETLAADAAASLSRSAAAALQLNQILLVLADPPTVLDEVSSPLFRIPHHEQDTGPCSLAVKGPLRSLREKNLEPGKVRCVPSQLPPGERAFRLVAKGRGQPSGAYLGRVTIEHAGGATSDVPVFVQIP